jgi:hypothetical protein
MNIKKNDIAVFALFSGGTVFLLVAFLCAKGGDFPGALIFAVPAQVLWTAACLKVMPPEAPNHDGK